MSVLRGGTGHGGGEAGGGAGGVVWKFLVTEKKYRKQMFLGF